MTIYQVIRKIAKTIIAITKMAFNDDIFCWLMILQQHKLQ